MNPSTFLRRLMTLFVLPLLVTVCWAQTPDQLIEQALEAADKQQYTQAAELLLQAAELYRTSGNHANEADLYNYAAGSLLKAGERQAGPETDQAIALMEKAAVLFENGLDRGKALNIRTLLGSLMYELGRFPEAEQCLQKAMPLLESLGDQNPELRFMAVLRMAQVTEAAHRWPEALSRYLEVLSLAKDLDPGEVPGIEVTIGAIYHVLGKPQKAEEFYRLAMASSVQQNRPEETREAKRQLGALFMQQKRFADALPVWQDLVADYGSDPKGLDALFRVSLAHEGLGQFKEAYTILTQARERLTDVGQKKNIDSQRVKLLWLSGKDDQASALLQSDAFSDDYQRAEVAADSNKRELAKSHYQSHISSLSGVDRARALNSFAYRLLVWGESAQAEKSLNEALLLLPEKDSHLWATVKVNLGESFLKRGESPEARIHFEEALPWYEEHGTPQSLATVLNNAAACYSNIGELSKAVTYLERAVEVADRFQKPSPIQGTIANALGYCYVQLGRYGEGIGFYKKALVRHQASGNQNGERTVFFNLGAAQILNGDNDAGFQAVEKAIDMAHEADDKELQVLIIGFLTERVSDPKLKQELLEKAGRLLPQVEGKTAKALFLNSQAQAALDNGQWESAKTLARDSLALFPDGGAVEQTFAARRILLLTALKEKKLDEAGELFEPILRAIETRIWGLSSREARSFIKSHGSILKAYGIALLKADRKNLAFAIQEKERSLGLAALTADVKFDDSKIDAKLVSERAQLASLIRREQSAHSADPEVLESLVRNYRVLLDRVEREYVAAGLVSKVTSITVEELQASLDSQEAVLEFVIGEDEAFLILVRADVVNTYPLGAVSTLKERAAIAYKVVSKYRTVKTIDREMSSLGSLLLGEAWPDLQGVTRLVIVPGDGLYSIPFAALRVDQQTVIDRFQITVANSASAWLASRQTKSKGVGSVVGALGDFKGEDGSLTPLPGTEAEAEAVSGLLSQPQVFLGRQLQASDLEQASRGKQVMHLATHGFLDKKDPLLSGLSFSDRRVTAADIFGWNLDADLAVLSACDSGGFADKNEYLGLSSAFQYAGVRTLVVSLWPVSDQATEFWMKEFYAALAGGASPSEAMQKAHVSTRKNWENPFFWAPFTTWGDGLSSPAQGKTFGHQPDRELTKF
jgi:CHAT domain-containing protein/Tfp pilus assembly protein PilF